MIPAGLRRHKVTYQTASRTRDAHGQPKPSWSNVDDFYVSIEPLMGRERLLALQVTPEATHKIKMLYDSRIGSKGRFLFGTRVFEIVGPPRNINEWDRELEITCKEIV